MKPRRGRPPLSDEERARRERVKQEKKAAAKAARAEARRLAFEAERAKLAEAAKAKPQKPKAPVPAPVVFVDRKPPPMSAPQRMAKPEPVEQSEYRKNLWPTLMILRPMTLVMCRYNNDLTDELLQHAALRALLYEDKYVEQGFYTAWLARIIRNLYITDCRRVKRNVPMPVDDQGNAIEFPVDATQDGQVFSKELVSLLQTIEGDRQQTLVLICVMGFSYEEAAQTMGVTIGTVKSRLWRARAKLAALAGEQGLPVQTPA